MTIISLSQKDDEPEGGQILPINPPDSWFEPIKRDNIKCIFRYKDKPDYPELVHDKTFRSKVFKWEFWYKKNAYQRALDKAFKIARKGKYEVFFFETRIEDGIHKDMSLSRHKDNPDGELKVLHIKLGLFKTRVS